MSIHRFPPWYIAYPDAPTLEISGVTLKPNLYGSWCYIWPLAVLLLRGIESVLQFAHSITKADFPPLLFSLSVGCWLITPNVWSPFHLIAVLAAALGCYYSSRSIGPVVAWMPLAIIMGSQIVAVAPAWATPGFAPTIGQVWILLMLGLFYVANHDSRRLFRWLTPVILFHALVIIIEGMTSDGRAGGLIPNLNVAGGLMAVGTVMFAHGSQWKSASLTISALMLTGSRWATVVCLILAAYWAISQPAIRQHIWKVALSLLVLPLIVGVINYQDLPHVYRLEGPVQEIANQWTENLVKRTADPVGLTLTPRSPVATDGLHITPLRIGAELGLPAALCWLSLAALTLWRLRQGGYLVWVFACLIGLSVLDYYVWLGGLAPLWWALVSIGAKPPPEQVGEPVATPITMGDCQ